MDLWHTHDGIISEPADLAWHIEINRRNASIIVQAIATDFEAAIGPITEVLGQDYDEDYLEDEECLDEPIPTPPMEAREDWAVPSYDAETWDTLTEVLDWIGLSQELKENFTDKLRTECLDFIAPWTISKGVQDAIEIVKQHRTEASEEDIIRVAAPLISSQISETLKSRGEALALYATIRLMVNNPDR
jgi:hypothetical protein